MNQLEREFIKQNPAGEFWNKPVTRRSFLRTAGRVGLVLGAGLAGDTLQGELMWGGTSPEVHIINNFEAKEKFPDTFTLAIGGFNVANTEGLGHDVEALLGNFGQVAYLKNSNDGLDMRDIERETLKFIEENGVNRLRLYGHSMGGMVAVELAKRIKDKVGHLEAIILDCTPASELDIKGNGRLGAWALQAFDKLSLHFGPNTRVAVEAFSSVASGRNGIIEGCLQAMNKVSGNICSNKLVQSQASFMRAFNVNDYKNCFHESTHVIRLRPYDYAADPTINNETSLPRWCSGLNKLITDVPILGGGHANPGACKDHYRISLQTMAKQLGFYDGTPPRSNIRPI